MCLNPLYNQAKKKISKRVNDNFTMSDWERFDATISVTLIPVEGWI